MKLLKSIIGCGCGETLLALAAAAPRCTCAYVISGNYVHVDVARG